MVTGIPCSYSSYNSIFTNSAIASGWYSLCSLYNIGLDSLPKFRVKKLFSTI